MGKSSRGSASRVMPALPFPVISVEGNVREAGEQLGALWMDAYQHAAAQQKPDAAPWWQQAAHRKLIRRYAPYLPDFYAALARGAKLKPEQISVRAVVPPACTSFALAPAVTLARQPLSGQTKDTSVLRGLQMQVLRLRFTDGAPSHLMVTYPTWFGGYGFVAGGCTFYGNALYVEPRTDGKLLLDAFATLVHHCPDVEHVMRLARDYPVASVGHFTVADEQGGIVGLENGPGPTVFCKPQRGIYVHANAVLRDRRLRASEDRRADEKRDFRRPDSEARVAALTASLQAERGRLTPQLLYGALMDHHNHPASVCRHQSEQAATTAVIIAEPTQRRLTAVRGPACQNWPQHFAV